MVNAWAPAPTRRSSELSLAVWSLFFDPPRHRGVCDCLRSIELRRPESKNAATRSFARKTGRFQLTRITVKFTAKEIELLSSLVSDQLFRREFIDSRLPGSNSNSAELSLGKKLVARLRSVADRATTLHSKKNGATH